MVSKKRKVNKSEEIRNYVSSHRDASAREVVHALKKRGIVVSEPTVATVKSKAGLSKPRKQKTSSNRRATVLNGQSMSVDLLCEAKVFATKAGSLEAAIAALEAVQKIETVSV